MDPYKLVGFDEHLIKTEDDLERVRQRVKKKWKQLAAEGNKFEAANLNRAWETVKQRFRKPVESTYGRSRKERELEGFFNHQTKELRAKKDEIRLQREKADKYGMFNQLSSRQAKGMSQRDRRKAKEQYKRAMQQRAAQQAASAPPPDPIAMIQRVLVHCEVEHKFVKSLKFVRRWVYDFMDWETRAHAFHALMRLVDTGYLCNHPEALPDVQAIFEHMLELNPDFVELNPEIAILWRRLIVLHCRLHKADDTFAMGKCLTELRSLCNDSFKPDLEFNRRRLADGEEELSTLMLSLGEVRSAGTTAVPAIIAPGAILPGGIGPALPPPGVVVSAGPPALTDAPPASTAGQRPAPGANGHHESPDPLQSPEGMASPDSDRDLAEPSEGLSAAIAVDEVRLAAMPVVAQRPGSRSNSPRSRADGAAGAPSPKRRRVSGGGEEDDKFPVPSATATAGTAAPNPSPDSAASPEDEEDSEEEDDLFGSYYKEKKAEKAEVDDGASPAAAGGAAPSGAPPSSGAPPLAAGALDQLAAANGDIPFDQQSMQSSAFRSGVLAEAGSFAGSIAQIDGGTMAGSQWGVGTSVMGDQQSPDSDDEDEAAKYIPPPEQHIKIRQRREFVACLGTLFKLRERRPALKSQIDPFFLEIFQTRSDLGLSKTEKERVEELQAAIKTRKKDKDLGLSNANAMEAQNPVVDGRSMAAMGDDEWGGGANR